MPFLDEILDILPNSLQELKTQCIRHGVEDYPQVESLLIDTKLSSGLHRDWRKAVFRLLDNIFARFKLHIKHTYDRLDAKLFPFTSYYCPLLLTCVLENLDPNEGNETILKRNRAAVVQEEIQRVISFRQDWSRTEVLIHCLSSYEDLEEMCLKFDELLDDTQIATWIEFAKCLKIADKYDMSRKVYQSLDQDDVWIDIKHLSFEDRGEVLDLWQSTIDTGTGEYGKLKRAIFKIVKETNTLPNKMILRDITLQSREAVHGGGCADIYKAIWRNSLVALKVLRIFNKEDLKAVYRELCKEAIIWRQLKDENVAPFYGLCKGLFPNRVALVAPWMSNGDLSSYLSRNPDADRVTFSVQIASGMKYLHSQDPQIIHGDLRANNVLVNDKLEALITDFGISKVNVVQTKLSVQSNRGSARWQAPELHYNEEGLSHVTTKSDVYAYGMTCFEIFTDTMPFAHLSSDGMVIMEIVQKKSKPRRPTDPLAEKRGLTDRLWTLLEDCWAFEAPERPTMDEVSTIVRNESRFIAKEREQLKLRASALVVENTALAVDSSGEQLSTDEDKVAADDETRPVLHSPIKVSLELRLDESDQHLQTAVFPSRLSSNPSQLEYALTETDSADIMGQFMSRGRYHATISQDNGETNKDLGITLKMETRNSHSSVYDTSSPFVEFASAHPIAPGLSHELSDSSIMTRSSMSTAMSKSSEQSYQTMFTSPESSPVQEKKDSLKSIIHLDDERDTIVDGVVPTDSAANINAERILTHIRSSQVVQSQTCDSFGNSKSKPNTLDANAMKSYDQRSSEGTWTDSPKSGLKSLPGPSDTRASTLSDSRSSSSDFALSDSPLSTRHVASVPRMTESPHSFPREHDNPSISDEPQTEVSNQHLETLEAKQTSTSIFGARGAENRGQSQRAWTSSPRLSQEQPAEAINKPSETNEDAYVMPVDKVIVPPRTTERKPRNRMGAIKIGYRTQGEVSEIPSAALKGTLTDRLTFEPDGEPDADPWELNDPTLPNEYETDAADPLQTEDQKEKESLLKYTVLDVDEQKKQLPDFESIIDEDVRDFFDKRDLDNARTYFIALPAESRYKLIARLALHAILTKDDEDIDTLFLAELFDKYAVNGSPSWCSASDYEKASRLVVQVLNTDPSVDGLVASRRFDVILEGMELSEAFKTSMLRQLCKTSSSAPVTTLRNSNGGTIATHSTFSNATFNKVKID